MNQRIKDVKKMKGAKCAWGLLFILIFSHQSASFAQSDALNGPTSFNVLGNPFSQPNIQLQLGRKTLDWYGSGDVNNDGRIDFNDVSAINHGVSNDRSDVNGDGITNWSDAELISSYLNGKLAYLPGHWDELTTKEERISWLDKTTKIDSINVQPLFGQLFQAGWICADFALQRAINFYGISNIDEYLIFLKKSNGTDHFGKDNARFNIPVCIAGVTASNGQGHAICCALVGNNPLNFSDWYFFSNYTDLQVYPGHAEMDLNSGVQISSNGYLEDSLFRVRYFSDVILMQLKLENGVAHLTDIFGLKQRINPKSLWIKLTAPEDTLINYEKTLSLATHQYGTAKVETNFDTTYSLNFTNGGGGHYEIKNIIKRTFSISDTVFLTTDKLLRNFYYKVKRWNVIKLIQTQFYNNPISGSYTSEYETKRDSTCNIVTVKDIEPPTFKLPPDITITKDQLLTPSVTGYPINVLDNTGLAVDTSYIYDLVSEDSTMKVYDVVWTFTDKFDNSASGVQKVTVNMTTDIDNNIKDSLPKEFKLYQNYPNPFNPTTTIKFSIPSVGAEHVQPLHVLLKVYDLLGRKVATLVNEEKSPGNYEVKFDVETRRGESLPSGVYFYVLSTNGPSSSSGHDFIQSKKMLLMK